MSSTYQTLQSHLYSEQGVGVLFHVCIKAVEVNAELQATIFLPYQYHPVAPCTLARPDSTRLQHLLQLVLNLLNQQRGNPPKSLFKGSVICHFYHVFSGVGTAQFCGVQQKHVIVLSQKLVGSICQLWRPRIQPTQIQFIEQSLMSLPDSQFGGMRVLGLSTLLLQLNFLRWFGHWEHCYCPGHWDFLLEGLQVSCTISYHHDCIFTFLPQLCVCILYSEALWQRAIFHP